MNESDLQQGPCLQHCYCTWQTALLAYAALAYLIGTGVYYIACFAMCIPTVCDDDHSGARWTTMFFSIAASCVLLAFMRTLLPYEMNSAFGERQPAPFSSS